VGAVNINGDLPVILGPDGPTAGGFVCAATIAYADFWKIGQLRPVGDTVRFREVTIDEAIALQRTLDDTLSPANLEPV
jgi:urea carboxylase